MSGEKLGIKFQPSQWYGYFLFSICLFRWYPPGHGNLFASLAFSGELDRLLVEGRDIIFVSNIDNTGAVIEPSIAQVI